MAGRSLLYFRRERAGNPARLFSMNNKLATALRDALNNEFTGREARKYFVVIIDNLDLDSPVVLSTEVTKDACVLRYCYLLSEDEHERLTASQYVPRLRSKICLTVGLGESGDIPYAYSSVKLPPYGNAIELLDALYRLGRELEAYLSCLTSAT